MVIGSRKIYIFRRETPHLVEILGPITFMPALVRKNGHGILILNLKINDKVTEASEKSKHL